MLKVKHLGLFLVALMAVQSFAFAGGENCEAKLKSDSYLERAPWRLVHGIVNLGTSPAHLIAEPVKAAKAKSCIIKGLGNGVIQTGKYAILGAWDVVTFWVPGQAGKDMAVLECGISQIKKCEPCEKSSENK